MAGDGVAIDPDPGPEGRPATVVAPCDGRLTVLFPGGHALAVTTSAGLEVIVHLGLDTVELGGEGFEALVHQGDGVRAGQPLVRFDLMAVRTRGKSALSPVLVAASADVVGISVTHRTSVEAGRDTLISVVLKDRDG
jgi:glucose-specific phosphotransferase system IIA component